MGNLFSLATTISSSLNCIIAFYLAYRLFNTKNKSYLNEQFKHFFIYFGSYFVLTTTIINTTLENPYLFFVSLEASHFILSFSVAYLFSAFIYLRHAKKTKTAYWSFVIIGFTISLFGVATINPQVSSLNAGNAYLYMTELFIPKFAFLGFGFLYPVYSFIKEALVTKNKAVKEKYFLLAAAFLFWLVGGALHSQNERPLIFLTGDLILLIGFIFSAIVLLQKNTDEVTRR